MIPKIIHQTWKDHDITKRFKQEWADSWLECNPGWERRFWTDSDLDAFIREEYPKFVDVWDEYDVPIKKPDSARYLILKKFGGLYADMDFACLKSFDSLVNNLGDKFLITTEGDPGSPDTLCNALMACKPGCDFLEGIEAGFRKARHRHVLESSATLFITKWAKSRAEQIFSPKTKEIFPLWWNDPMKEFCRSLTLDQLKSKYPDSYAITFWTHTWKGQ